MVPQGPEVYHVAEGIRFISNFQCILVIVAAAMAWTTHYERIKIVRKHGYNLPGEAFHCHRTKVSSRTV